MNSVKKIKYWDYFKLREFDIKKSFVFIVLFCFSKKEPKKEPDKGLHPLCGVVP